jgi:hypothetical protein
MWNLSPDCFLQTQRTIRIAKRNVSDDAVSSPLQILYQNPIVATHFCIRGILDRIRMKVLTTQA